MTPSARRLIGETIDSRYHVEALLGEGGMGLVYRVTHTRLQKPLAIKVLRRENTTDPEVLARFQREAESASAVGNRHIVDVHDFGTLEDGSTYFVMECLEGMDLIEAMDITPRIPQERAVGLAIQVCKALGAAHDAGIVHRDLKPENVFLTRRDGTDDFVKVLDFGIAKVANGPSRLTRQGEVLGTPHYMSPEQCEGENVDHRTDIYALGVLIYEMVTGHVPHDADTVMGILTKHLYEDPIPPKIRAPQISDELEHVVLRCLEKSPDRRYQTMRELEADLERVQSGLRPVGPETVTLTPTRPPAPTRSDRRVSPTYLGALAVALLALAGKLALGAGTDSAAAPTSLERGDVPMTSVAPVAPAQPASPAPEDEARASAEPSREGVASPPTKRVSRPSTRKRKAPANGATKHDPAILDPWK